MIRIFIYMFTICFLFLQCTGGQISGGSETTNGVTVTVVQNNISITGPAGSNVNIYSADYLPSSNTGPLTSLNLNDSGLATLNQFLTGIFNIFLLNPSDSTVGIIHSVSVPKKVNTSWHGKLEFPGALSGKLMISNASTNGNAVVYIIGTPFIDTISLDNSIVQFNFNRIPPGNCTIEYNIKDINPAGLIIGVRKGTLTTVAVKSNQNLNIQEPFRIP